MLALLAACKGEQPIHDGISRLHVEYRGRAGEHWVEAKYTVRLGHPPTPGSMGVAVKAACQIGDQRLVVVEPGVQGALEQGVAKELDAAPFLIHPLHADPSLCQLDFIEASFDAPRPIATVCLRDKLEHAPCPPNTPHGTPGPTGVSATLDKVTGHDAEDPWPAHLTVEYTVTAHRDMAKGAYLVRATNCGGRTDVTWHSDLEYLRAGESFDAAQNTYPIGRPSGRCETEFGTATVVNGEVTAFAKFCHEGDRIVPCG
jgi:hypothetical protein